MVFLRTALCLLCGGSLQMYAALHISLLAFPAVNQLLPCSVA